MDEHRVGAVHIRAEDFGDGVAWLDPGVEATDGDATDDQIVTVPLEADGRMFRAIQLSNQ
jgi:hypothetical protein